MGFNSAFKGLKYIW